MAVVAVAPLVEASYKTCSRKLLPGEIKRVQARGPLVGYFIGCPACKFIAPYLQEEVGAVEEALPAGTYPRKILTFTTPPRCIGCRRELVIVEDRLEARE